MDPLDLVDLTLTTTQSAFELLSDKTTAMTVGWYINLDAPVGLDSSERVVESPLTVAGSVFFTSFKPHQDICGYGGESRLYAIDFESGVSATSEEGMVLSDLDVGPNPPRYKELQADETGEGGGYASPPVYHFGSDGKKHIYVQTSDGTVGETIVTMDEDPLMVLYWISN